MALMLLQFDGKAPSRLLKLALRLVKFWRLLQPSGSVPVNSLPPKLKVVTYTHA